MYDHKNNTSIWRECMRIKIHLDVRSPLKRKKKITRKNGSKFVVSYKYESLVSFVSLVVFYLTPRSFAGDSQIKEVMML